MNSKTKISHRGRVAAVIACSAALGGTAAGIAPGAASAQAGKSCGAKTISVKVKGGKAVRVPASRIRAEGGATCADAEAVIRGVLLHRPPKGWTVSHGNFKVPEGLTPYVAVNGRKKVSFALVGR